MTAWVRPFISHVRSPRSFGASVLISAALLFSLQLAVAQSVFTQQGPKLVGTDVSQNCFSSGCVPGAAWQGWSVALSADGNTALVGGPFDFTTGGGPGPPPFGALGAVWVFTRSGGVWNQQGPKLIGGGVASPDRIPQAQQGYSVALSANGNTAIVGAPNNNSQTGAAWVFVQRTKDDCKDGGWLNFIGPPGPFTNQGQCMNHFAKLK
jgi:hypothetical protein